MFLLFAPSVRSTSLVALVRRFAKGAVLPRAALFFSFAPEIARVPLTPCCLTRWLARPRSALIQRPRWSQPCYLSPAFGHFALAPVASLTVALVGRDRALWATCLKQWYHKIRHSTAHSWILLSALAWGICGCFSPRTHGSQALLFSVRVRLRHAPRFPSHWIARRRADMRNRGGLRNTAVESP